MGVEAKARATEKDYRVNTTTCMPGAYDQKNIHRRLKGHARPHPSFSWHMGLITTNQASIRSTLDDVAGVQRTAWYRVCVRKYHVVGELFICEKASLSKWSEIRVLRIEKITIASLKDVVVLTQFYVMYTANKKKWSISALEILSLCSSVEDSLLECLRANI